MNTQKNLPWSFGLLAATLLSAVPALAAPNQIDIAPNFTPNPLEYSSSTLQLKSGGPVNSSGCGWISQTPNHVLKVTERLNTMKISVTGAGGTPTLLIKGDKGDFCAIADPGSGINAEIGGVWLEGNYKIYVGDLDKGSYDYVLQFSR